jgi:hypothetical protein
MTETILVDVEKLKLAQVLTEIDRVNLKVKTLQRILSNREKDLAEVLDALRPFAALANVCDHFKRLPDQTICSWRIAGEHQRGPTADDCRNARTVINAIERTGVDVGPSQVSGGGK